MRYARLRRSSSPSVARFVPMSAPTCWLVNSGTSQDPLISQPVLRFREWISANGDVQGFSRSPTGIAVGDLLIHRAVGSAGDKLVAIGEVTGPATHHPRLQWPWRLPRRLTHLCTSLDVAPRSAEVGVDATGMRTYIKPCKYALSRYEGILG